ncbi:N/A [soil metagenome]
MWSKACNVLCIRLDTLGDVLMTTPALKALRAGAPGRRMTLLTSSAGAEAAALVPEVDETIVYDAVWLKATPPRADGASERAMAERLERAAFDAAIIFTVYSQNPLPSALMCHLADIPLRLAHCRENPYGLLTDWVRDTEPETGIRHEVRRQLDLVASIGCRGGDEKMSLRVPEAARAAVDDLLDRKGIDVSSPWVVVHPGASAASRRYEPEGFAAVAQRLAGDGIGVLFTGAAHEGELVELIRARCGAPSCSVAGELDVAELAALIDRAPLLISNNTGPVHIACAVGTPLVDLYALTNPQHTPWGVPHRVLFHDVPCKWCLKSVCPEGHHNCLRLVSPEAVVEAAHELLDAGFTLGTGARVKRA